MPGAAQAELGPQVFDAEDVVPHGLPAWARCRKAASDPREVARCLNPSMP
jgi:hypothetical protein